MAKASDPRPGGVLRPSRPPPAAHTSHLEPEADDRADGAEGPLLAVGLVTARQDDVEAGQENGHAYQRRHHGADGVVDVLERFQLLTRRFDLGGLRRNLLATLVQFAFDGLSRRMHHARKLELLELRLRPADERAPAAHVGLWKPDILLRGVCDRRVALRTSHSGNALVVFRL